ncbi:beta-glucosidase 18-like [Dioscorea cayenensis subsp. rotundata]|uniref:Beta-glucosidase 18-like n=1 Tax=Dioscorea cayennensis subsp. rotundata TaxID=55577 RepID=A0AB40D970_DIOCR|nr:beta-glucosidase 18-like [Dioscorea cayenensis subsp. rotundata]
MKQQRKDMKLEENEYPPGLHSQPYVTAHNMILSHATALHIYKTKYQEKQGGSIGIVLSMVWYEPLKDTVEDNSLVQSTFDFEIGWFLDPFIYGDYPNEMKKYLGPKLPTFSAKEKEKLRYGLNFIGMNYYKSLYVGRCGVSYCKVAERDGIPIGKKTPMPGRKGADVRGYLVWSLIYYFEWIHGYTLRFGIYHVDYNTQKRTPKSSAKWFKDFPQCSKITARKRR